MRSVDAKRETVDERLVRAAAENDAARMRKEVERLLALLAKYPAGAAAILERAAIALAKVHLLDDLRRALGPALEARVGEALLAQCSPTARAAWKYAAYDLPFAAPAEAQDLLEPLPDKAPLPPPKPPRPIPETRDPG